MHWRRQRSCCTRTRCWWAINFVARPEQQGGGGPSWIDWSGSWSYVSWERGLGARAVSAGLMGADVRLICTLMSMQSYEHRCSIMSPHSLRVCSTALLGNAHTHQCKCYSCWQTRRSHRFSVTKPRAPLRAPYLLPSPTSGPSPLPQALELCPQVQDAVARLCCAWWAANGPDKEELLSQTLPFLLVGGAWALCAR